MEILELLHTLTRRPGRTVVVVLHDLNFAVNYGDSLVFYARGKLKAYCMRAKCLHAELIKRCLMSTCICP